MCNAVTLYEDNRRECIFYVMKIMQLDATKSAHNIGLNFPQIFRKICTLHFFSTVLRPIIAGQR